MARTAVATLQVVWDCRWSQPGHRLTNVPEAEQPESRWVCTRDGHRRGVDEYECETCAYWERSADPLLPVLPAPAVAAELAAPEVPNRIGRALDLGARVIALLTAIVFAVSGFAILTGPLMVPFVVVLWLGAAAFGAFTFFGRFPVSGETATPGA